VGSAFKNFQGEKAGQRVGTEASPTPKPAAGAHPASHPTAAPVNRSAATKPPQQASALTVKITASGFDPTAARVYQGSLVTVTNTDSTAHSYTSADLTYDTGMLGPGQSKGFTTTALGKFQMTDKSRNWIIGSLEVVRR
jgi:plastocyanin